MCGCRRGACVCGGGGTRRGGVCVCVQGPSGSHLAMICSALLSVRDYAMELVAKRRALRVLAHRLQACECMREQRAPRLLAPSAPIGSTGAGLAASRHRHRAARWHDRATQTTTSAAATCPTTASSASACAACAASGYGGGCSESERRACAGGEVGEIAAGAKRGVGATPLGGSRG